jgi:uncharacterized membrane protein YphA (DoxX/SURF4 family)
MASLTLHLLTVLLGVIFVFLGHIKLTGQFFPEYHTQIKNEFGKLNKEFPLYQLTGWRPYAKNYRIGVGVAEMSAGSLLLLAGGMRIIFYRNKRLGFFCFSFFTIICEFGFTCDNDKYDNCLSKITLWC